MLAGPQWFTDELPDLHTKDAAIQIAGKWIIEVSELSALRRSDVETIKKFMGRSVDTYRALYARTTEDHPRQCVFVATTNDEHYLKDQTGNRRFWPLACGSIDIKAIQRDRNQLWAEAFTRHQSGERWWLQGNETTLAETEQEARREIDPWDDPVAAHVATLHGLPTTISQVCFVLHVPFERLNSTVNKRVAQCLKRAGYVRKQVRHGDQRTWQYVRE
jgi:predicted P-loop ATPase